MNQSTSEHDDVKNHSAKHSAENLIKNFAKNFERNHFDDDNVLLKEWNFTTDTSECDTSKIVSRLLRLMTDELIL